MIKNTRSFTADFELNGPFESSFYNEKLWVYFKTIWSDTAEYKVLIARRMLNLNDALMREWNENNKEQFFDDGIMSNIAFLLAAEDIADRYARRRSFPRILVCDDIMLHGRGISTLLARFREIVINRLNELQVEIDPEELDIDLRNAIRIYLFARNKDDSLLIDRGTYRLYTTLVLPLNYLRELSYYISYYLLNSGTPNTSYVISAELSWRQWNVLKTLGDLDSDDGFRYMRKRQDIFIRNRNPQIMETIRIYYPYDDPKRGCILTSLPIFEDIYEDSLNRLCKRIAESIEYDNRYDSVLDILCQNDPLLIKPKAQFISFIYSVLGLGDFCRQYLYVDENDLYKLMISGDVEKIIINFNDRKAFRREVLTLIKELCMNKSIGQTLWKHAVNSFEDLKGDSEVMGSTGSSELFRHISGPESEQRVEIRNKAENIFYNVGMRAEIEAYNHIHKKTPFNASKSKADQISFDDYRTQMKDSKLDYNVGSIFGLMDSGLIAMNLERVMDANNQIKVQTVLKAGEMATYILPRRFSVFIPAFAKVEKYYGGVYKQPQDIIRAFIDYLQDHCYQQEDTIDQRDRKLLDSLKDSKESLVKLYDAGQRFKDWDIDLRTDSSLRPSTKFARDDDQMTSREEWARKRYYSYIASMFVDQISMDTLVNN